MKHIRELRIGRPKSYKTGAVVNTYPKPMLVFEGDEGGLTIAKDPVIWIKDEEYFKQACNVSRASQPSISAYQFANLGGKLFDQYGPIPQKGAMAKFNAMGNLLLSLGDKIPWKTFVLDPATELTELILGDFCVANSAKMADARKWAYPVGLKVSQTMQALYTLKCHVVIIMHTQEEREVNEAGETKRVYEEPVIYSKVRTFLGHIPDQYLYAWSRMVGGKQETKVDTISNGKVEGLGCRWPQPIAATVGATFNEIYGEAVKKGETYA